jgi:hypothetical protein
MFCMMRNAGDVRRSGRRKRQYKLDRAIRVNRMAAEAATQQAERGDQPAHDAIIVAAEAI